MGLSTDVNRRTQDGLGGDGAGRPAVHHVRYRSTADDPDGFDPVGVPHSSLAVAVLDQIGHIVAAVPVPGTVAVSFSRLPDGSRVLCRLSASPLEPGDGSTALDARIVHVPVGAALPPRPIDCWPEAAWPPLPADGGLAPPAHLRPTAFLDQQALITFAREHEAGLEVFLTDLRGLFDQPSGPQLVLVAERPDEVAAWIALAAASLPSRTVSALTFTTFTRSPRRAPQQVVGIPPEAAGGFSAEELTHLFRVRGAGAGDSPPPPNSDRWARVAARLWLHGEPELIASGPNGAEEPFAAERLTVTALVHEVALDQADRLGAAHWLGLVGNIGQFSDQEARLLADVMARTAEECRDRLSDAAPAADGGAGSRDLEALIRAHATFSRRCDQAVIEPLSLALARPMVRAALRNCAQITGDPLARLQPEPAVYRLMGDEFGGEILAVLEGAERQSVDRLGGALEAARVLGVDWSRARDQVAGRMARALIEPGLVAERAAAFAVLDRDLDHALGAGVVVHFENHARQLSTSRNVQTFASTGEGSAYLSRQDLTRLPALRLIVGACDLIRQHSMHGYQLFEKLWRATPQPAERRVLDIMWRMSWPTVTIDLRSAVAVSGLIPPDSLIQAGFSARLVEVFTRLMYRDDIWADVEMVTELAERLLADQGHGLDGYPRSVAELLVLARAIENGGRSLAGLTSRLDELVISADLEPYARDWALAKLVERLVEAPGQDLLEPRVYTALAKSQSPQLREMYLARHTRDRARALRSRLAGAPVDAAGRFLLWDRLAAGNSPDWSRAGGELIRRVLEPVLGDMDERQANEVREILEKADPGGPPRWDQWCAGQRSVLRKFKDHRAGRADSRQGDPGGDPAADRSGARDPAEAAGHDRADPGRAPHRDV